MAASDGDADPQKLVERLHILVREHSQAGLARKGGTTRRNVHRYLGGTKPPVDFLVHLCRSTGLNPGWLLMGVGPMYGSGEGTDSADSFMKAIRAADSTMELRLHALAKLPKLKVYNEVVNRLNAIENKIATQSEKTANILRRLIQQAFEEGSFPNYDRSLPILRVVERLLPLVNDSDLAARVYQMMGTAMHNAQHSARAGAYYTKALLIRIVNSEPADDKLLHSALSYAVSQMNLGEIGIADRIAGMIELLHPASTVYSRHLLVAMLVRGECQTVMGHVSVAQERIRAAVAHSNEGDLLFTTPFLLLTGLWSGTERLGFLGDSPKEEGHYAFTAATYALFTENAKDLSVAIRLVRSAKQKGFTQLPAFETHLQEVWKVVSPTTRSSRDRVRKSDIDNDEVNEPPQRIFEREVQRLQLKRLRGHSVSSREIVDAHDQFLHHCCEAHRYTLYSIMVHIKNILLGAGTGKRSLECQDAVRWATNELNRRFLGGFGALLFQEQLVPHLWMSSRRTTW